MLTLRRFARQAALLALTFVVGCESNSADLTAPTFSVTRAPSGIQAIAVSERRIDIGWQDESSNEAGFEVHRSLTGATGTFTLLVATGPNANSHSDLDLTAGTQYCYKVRSFRKIKNSISYSAFSATACATTLQPLPPPPSPPNTPIDVGARPYDGIFLELNWRLDPASIAADGFRVERSLDGGATWPAIGSTNSDARAFWDWDVSVEVMTCYRVIAFNRAGNSPASNASCTAMPRPAANLIATLADTTIVDLTWEDVSDLEDGYVVERVELAEWYAIAWLPANATSYRDTDLYRGGDFSYRIRSTRDGGTGLTSNYVSLVTP